MKQLKVLPHFISPLKFIIILFTVFLSACSYIDLTGINFFTKDISSFFFSTSNNSGIIPYNIYGVINNDTIDITVPFGTPLKLTPTIDFDGDLISPASNVSQTYFDGAPFLYTVNANDNTSKTYTVYVHVAPSNACDITVFTFYQSNNLSLTEDISGTITGTDIDITLPQWVNTSALVPSISISGISINPPTDTAYSFPDGTGVQYTVTAADTTTKDYTVTVFTPPQPGNAGLLSFTAITENSITVNWEEADDGLTPETDLQYRVYYSSSNNIDTLANIETFGIPVGSYTTGITSVDVTGLTESQLYYFNVIVIDENGNESAYSMNSEATTDTTAPVAGNVGIINVSAVDATSITVDWTKATDNISDQADLQYLLYYSKTSSNVNTVSSMKNSAIPFGSFSTDINHLVITGLIIDTTYYFNIIVMDEAGNKSTYTKNSQLTADNIPPNLPSSALDTLSMGQNGVYLIWTLAADNYTAQADLQYCVYYSTTNNINTVAEMEANGTAFGTYTTMASAGNKMISGLSPSTTYYFNVIARDESGNQTAYTIIDATTE